MTTDRTVLSVGDSAPELDLHNQDGETRSLTQLRGAAVIVYFFPKAFTPGCTKEVCDFRDSRSDLERAGYTVFDDAPPPQSVHAGIGAPYAHVTAPLRRLVDRYGTEICLAVQRKSVVPDWVRERLPTLPATMGEADRLAHEVDRAVVDMTEAWLLRDRVGQRFGPRPAALDR